MNLPESLIQMGSKRNIMREIREYGLLRAREVGAEKVLDFSLGNPSVEPPRRVNDFIRELLSGPEAASVHGYTTAQGELGVREKLAASLTRRFGGPYDAGDLYLTVGAAAALCCCFRALACPGDQFILLAPFFTEYTYFITGNGGEPVVVPPDYATFQPDLGALERAITSHTKAVVVNSPNNPSGVVYTAETLSAMAELLRRKAAEYGHPIYLISDEPYREIVFEGFSVPWLPDFYDDTLVCYSYSKSLSLPGERIGYILIGKPVADREALYAAICGAGRVLGYVNAPSLFQQVTSLCCDRTSDLAVYERNAKLLVPALREMGYHCVEPGGAFYLFPRSLEPDDMAFSERAKQFDLLLVPGSGFGAPGHVRIAYCVQTDMIQRALPKFKALADSYR